MDCGYDVTFTSDLDRRFQCPICLLALRNPMQTACGHRFCNACITQTIPYKNTVLTCPIDKTFTRVNQMFRDLATEREIMSLHVHCINAPDKCLWTGELRDLDGHRSACLMEKVLCTNGCTMKIRRMDFTDHEGKCTHRLVQCQHCPERIALNQLREHKETCPKLPIACSLCLTVLPREDLPKHQHPTEGECSKTIISCPYADIGCKFENERQQMVDHTLKAEVVQEHLNLALQKIVQMDHTVHNLSKALTKLEGNMSLIPDLVQSDKKHKQTTNELRERNVTGKLHWKVKLAENRRTYTYVSPAFYTGCPGYKVQLILDIEGPREGTIKYTKMSIALLPGDYDQQVMFPFNGTCLVTLYDQMKCPPQQKAHTTSQLVIREVPRNSSGSNTQVDRIYKREIAKYMKCIDLIGTSSRYLRSGCLHFEVTVIHSYYPPEGNYSQGCICSALMPHGLEMVMTPKRSVTSYSDASTQAQSAQIMQLAAISIGN